MSVVTLNIGFVDTDPDPSFDELQQYKTFNRPRFNLNKDFKQSRKQKLRSGHLVFIFTLFPYPILCAQGPRFFNKIDYDAGARNQGLWVKSPLNTCGQAG